MLAELDLAACLLPSWTAAAALAAELPALAALDLSDARLAFPDPDPPTLNPSHPGGRGGLGQAGAGSAAVGEVGDASAAPACTASDRAGPSVGGGQGMVEACASGPATAGHASSSGHREPCELLPISRAAGEAGPAHGAAGEAAACLAEAVSVPFAALRLLVLNRTGVRWAQVRAALHLDTLQARSTCWYFWQGEHASRNSSVRCSLGTQFRLFVMLAPALFWLGACLGSGVAGALSLAGAPGQVLRLGPWLPALEELHAVGNGIGSLAPGRPADGDSALNPLLARLQARAGIVKQRV